MILRYAHLASAHKVKAVDILDAIVNGERKTKEISKEAGLPLIQYGNLGGLTQ